MKEFVKECKNGCLSEKLRGKRLYILFILWRAVNRGERTDVYERCRGMLELFVNSKEVH